MYFNSFINIIKVLCLGILLFISNPLIAQKDNPISVGERMPDISLGKFLDDPAKTIMFSQLKGKLVVLDFWNVWCKGCISAMPKMDSLQKQFGNKIQIILVTKNNRDEVEKLFKKIAIPKPNLPMVIADSILSNYFPSEAFPYHIWINPEGIVEYATEAHNATEEHIQTVLNRGKLQITNRPDINNNIDINQSILWNAGSTLLNHIEAYSILFKGLNTVTAESGISKIIRDSTTGKPRLIRALNLPIISFFNLAFQNDIYGFEVSTGRLINNNRLYIELDEPGKLQRPTNGNEVDRWDKENLLSYELKIPLNMSADIFEIMQQDLNRYLNYWGKIEKRKVSCLVLVRTSSIDKLSTKTLDVAKSGYNADGSYSVSNKSIKNSLFPSLVYANQYLATPIIDASNYEQNIDIVIKSSLNDSPELRKELKRYDLNLIEQIMEINMLVIRERK